jgi:hypothetical protein
MRRSNNEVARGGLSIVANAFTSAFLLLGCESMGQGDAEKHLPSNPVSASVYDSIPQGKINSESRKLASQAVLALTENRLEDASKFINQALKLNISNAHLQFLNGLIYHRQADAGDRTKLDLADKGYEISIQFDPSNWIPVYHRGLLNLDRRKYREAKKYFSQAAFLNRNEPGIFYNLAVASYYANDPVTAAGALSRLRSLGHYSENLKVLRASSMVMAALNEPAEARKYLARYKLNSKSVTQANRLDRRIAQWKKFYDHNQNLVLAQAEGAESKNAAQSDTPQEGQEVESQEGQEGESSDQKMVIVDVVIIRTEETNTTRKGINLLSGLTIQFGGGSLSTGGYSFLRSTTNPNDSPGITKVVTRSINIPSITYSLNIANSNTARNEILARPTLVALNGSESVFFSGTNIQASAIGTSSTASTIDVKQDIGVKLKVKPEILADGRIKLEAFAERTFLSTPNLNSITFDFRIDTSKTSVTSNVVMHFGETLILSGLSEKETEHKRDGVPGLQDVPLLQYFFAQRDISEFQKSVLILLTPRQTQYIHRPARKKKSNKKLSRDEQVLDELQSRFSDWFLPYPNWASVFNHLQENSLYREFRTGDVSLESWENQESRDNRLKRVLDFLYF